MRLYFVLFLLPLLGTNNLWIAPNNKSMATNNINDQLIAKKTDLQDLLTQHGLTIKDLSTDEQAVLKEMEDFIAQEDPSSIRKAHFIELTTKKLNEFNDSLGVLTKVQKYSIDFNSFENEFDRLNLQSPIADDFRLEIIQYVRSTTPQTVQVIYEGFEKVIIKYKNKKHLKEHYDFHQNLHYKSEEIVEDIIINDFNEIKAIISISAYTPVIDDPAFIETTAEYKENLSNRNSVEEVLIQLGQSIDSNTRSKYDKLNFNKSTYLNTVQLTENLEKILVSNDNDVQALYNTILNRFGFQVQITCYDALNVVIDVINSYRENDAYSQRFVDKKQFQPIFVYGTSIADALCNSKIGAGGDVNLLKQLEEALAAWKTMSMSYLNVMAGDSSKTIDTEYVQNHVQIGDTDLEGFPFKDLWISLVRDVTNTSTLTSISDVKVSLIEAIKNVDATTYLKKFQQFPASQFPNIQSLAAAINDSGIDTSFATYEKNWKTWSTSNLPTMAELKIGKNDKFYLSELKANLENIFGHPHIVARMGPGFFLLDDIKAVFSLSDYYDDDGDNIIDSDTIQTIWKKIVTGNTLPTSVDFEQVKRYIGGRELSNHINTYTNFLPKKADIIAAIKDSKRQLSISRGIQYSGTLRGEFVLQDNILNKAGIVREFNAVVNAYLKRKGKFVYVSSIEIKGNVPVCGITLGAQKIKFTKVFPHTIQGDTLTQNISMLIDVADFGGYSISTSGGVSGGAGAFGGSVGHNRGNSAPIGSGTYITTLTFKHINNTTENSTDFDIKDAKASRSLPLLQFERHFSSLLNKLEVTPK